jgi:hypothetical protein
MFCPRQKSYIQDFENQRYIAIFMSLRERARENKSESEKEKGNRKERERTKVRAIIFLNCLGQNEKSAKY